MWKPPQRIPFESNHGAVPTAQEAARALLFSPLQAGPLKLEQRTWVPAMVPWRATNDGFVTDAVVEWYSRFARGRPGAIVIEATGIRDVPSGPLLRIGHDRFIPGLQRLTEAVRDRLTGDIVACQFARTPGRGEIGPGAYGITACSRGGEGASGQPPGDYALYSGHNEQEGGVFRVDRRSGAVSVCYLRVERDKQGDAVTDSFVVCTTPFK